MPFYVVISNASGDHEYMHTQRIIAVRQYEAYCKKPETWAATVIHRTQKSDDVLMAYDSPNPAPQHADAFTRL